MRQVASRIVLSEKKQAVRSPASDYGTSGESVLIVRTHTPTSAMIDRINQWSSQIQSLYVLLDETNSHASEFSLRSSLKNGTSLFVYSSDDMQKTFPEFISLQHCKHGSFGYGFHVESIVLFLYALEYARPDVYANMRWLWVIENDAAFSGDIREFVEFYEEGYPHDLLTLKDGRLFFHDVLAWPYRESATSKFLATYPADARFCTQETVQRFSIELLRYLRDSVEKGLIAWSEMAAPTLCVAAGLSWDWIREEHAGYKSKFNTHISEDEWRSILSNPSQAGKWYHALKF